VEAVRDWWLVRNGQLMRVTKQDGATTCTIRVTGHNLEQMKSALRAMAGKL